MKNLPVGQYAVAFQDLVLMAPEEEKQKERNNRKETSGSCALRLSPEPGAAPMVKEGGWAAWWAFVQ